MSASTPKAAVLMSHLNDNHKAQMTTYLKFARSKRDENVGEVMHEFDDIKELRLTEDMYAVDDVRLIVDGLGDVVKTTMSKELDEFTQSNAMFLRHLFLQAEGNEIQLRVDPNVLHDESLMGDVKKMDRTAGDLPSASASKLAPIQGAVDVNLVAKLKDMEENGKRTQDRFVKLQAQYLELQKKNVELKDKLDQSEAAHSATKGDLASAVSDSSKNAQASLVVASNSAEMSALKNKVAELETELASRVMQTKQFQDLKKMLVKKNQQMKDIRSRLERYEPSAPAAADDDDSD